MAVTREILNSHPVSSLKTELAKVKKSLNYGKLKKEGLIDLILKNKEHFNHIKKYEAPPKPTPKPKEPEKPKPKPKEPTEDLKNKKNEVIKKYNLKVGDILISQSRAGTELTIKSFDDKYIKTVPTNEKNWNNTKKVNLYYTQILKGKERFTKKPEDEKKPTPKPESKPRQNLIRNPAYQTTGGKA